MKKKIKGVIFDLDGTLIDSGPDLLDSLNFVLKKKYLPEIPNNIVGNLVGGGAEAMIRRAFEFLNQKIDEEKVSEMINIFLDFYFHNCTNKTSFYPNITKIIKVLHKKNIKLAVCTNKKQFLANKILEEFKVSQFFKVILGSSKNLKLKPSKEMLVACIKKIELDTSECIMIGDSNNDIIPANELDIDSIFVNYGYGKLSEKVIPIHSIDKIEEILHLYDIN